MENIHELKISDEMSQSYIDYAMSVITDRALPDVRDGLKPVQRRILTAMLELSNTPDKPHRKSARIVGDTMGKYHPHGDSSIYDALVILAQDWKTRYPLVDGHGNFGSNEGDGAAAMRYTEARLTKIAMEMLTDINKDTVDFIPNFDETEKEPVILPSRIPNIFINGTTGIAVGMACETAPYNLSEIVSGITAYLKNEDITMEEMMEFIPGPDFPTGCEIINQADLFHVMSTGKGKIILRAKYEIENKGKKNFLIFTEIPYEVNKSRLLEDFCTKVNEGKILGVKNIADESNKGKTRITVELQKDMLPDAVAQQIYQLTDFQINFNLNNNVLVRGVPKQLGFLEMMKEYCDFQLEVLRRRTTTEREEALSRLNIVEGLLIALENVDEVVNIIRNSESQETAKTTLMNRFGLNILQAENILEIKLKKLVSMERIKFESEYGELKEKIKRLTFLLENKEGLKDLLITELSAIGRKYGDERRTRLSNLVTTSLKDLMLIAQEDVVVQYSLDGYIKAVKACDYKAQNRGGKGIANSESESDIVIHTNTVNNLLVVTDKGTIFKMQVRNIPHYKNNQKGINIQNLLPSLGTEKISMIKDMSRIIKPYIVFITKQGLVKKSSSVLYKKFRANGSKGITLKEGDEIVSVDFVDEDQLITLFSSNGKCITFNLKDINPIGKIGMGVRGINVGLGEVIASCLCDKNSSFALFTENGYGKKMSCELVTIQKRGGKGITCIKLSPKTGKLISANVLQNENNILIIGDNKSITIRSSDLNSLGRNTTGVVVLRSSKIKTSVILGE